jgi:hypothetical protein
MPSKERKEKELKRSKAKQEADLFWAEQIGSAPDHIKKKLGHPSQLSKALITSNTPHQRLGAKYDEITGELLKQVIPEGIGKNLESKENREATARALREKYKEIWGRRGAAKIIAHEEGLSVRTVQKYMKDFPN